MSGFVCGVSSVSILHVDDEQDMTALTADFLRRIHSDWAVDRAANAAEGLERYNGHDCIVSDFDMPGMNGIEFLKKIREDDSEIPFILFTGKGSEEIASEAISADVTDYLQKGIGNDQFEVLANRVENAVARYRAEQEATRGYEAIDAASEGIALLDVDGDFIYINDAFAKHYGYEKDDFESIRWEQLHDDAEVERFYDEIIPEVVLSGTWAGRTTAIRKDGSTIVEDHTITLTEDRTTVCVVRDITDNYENESALAGELAFLDDALDQLNDLFYIFDDDGTLLWWNDEMNRVTGYDDEELAVMKPVDFVREEDRDLLRSFIDEVRQNGSAQVEAELLASDGTSIPYQFYSTDFSDAAGEIIGRVGIGRDITTRKEYEWQLEQKNERLNEFAGVLSHDLKNPLTVAMMRSELLADEVGSDHEHLSKIDESLDRIHRITEDVLELARTGVTVSERESVDLGLLAENVWSRIERGRSDLSVKPIEVNADRSLLERLVTNLCRNTVEHGGEDVQVWIGPLEDSDGFYVEDDGPGIPESNRSEIFDWNFSTKEGGTGIGMRSVQQICDAHEWNISVTESESGGARFEITGIEFDDV